ncbi:hypothetical protein REPUB_Repub03eG0069400 [Reevesia pubescens]
MASSPRSAMEEQPPTTDEKSPTTAEEQPPPKKKNKQTHDSYFDEETEARLDAEESSKSDGYDSDGFREMTDSENKTYSAALRDSDGFDVPYFPDTCDVGMILPIPMKENTQEYLFPFAVAGINQYNEEYGTNYEVVRVEKCMSQVVCGIKYYITFHAKPKNKIASDGSSDIEIFEALVFMGIPEKEGDDEIESIFCRVKGTRPDL